MVNSTSKVRVSFDFSSYSFAKINTIQCVVIPDATKVDTMDTNPP